MDNSFRLAEILGALSLATDLSAGQMPESALGATILSVRMAQEMGVSEDDLVETYYTCVTRFIGCTSTAMEVAPMTLGDELSANYAFTLGYSNFQFIKEEILIPLKLNNTFGSLSEGQVYKLVRLQKARSLHLLQV